MRILSLFFALSLASTVWAQSSPIAVINSKAEFINRFANHTVQGFDGFTAGTVGPFTPVPMIISGVPIESTPQILNSLVGLTHATFFPGAGSAPNWLQPNGTLEFRWIRDINGNGIEAMGFDLQCFACDLAGQPSIMVVEAVNAGGAVLARAEFPVELLSTPRFIGFRFSSALNPDRIRINRNSGAPGFLAYLIDDVRFIYQKSLFQDGFEDFTR
jgi:hypothetical protein